MDVELHLKSGNRISKTWLFIILVCLFWWKSEWWCTKFWPNNVLNVARKLFSQCRGYREQENAGNLSNLYYRWFNLRGTTSLTAWNKVIFVNLKKKYKVMFSNENIRFSASYLHLFSFKKNKFSHCCSDCSLQSAWNQKSQKFYLTRIYFLYNDPRL